MKKAVVTTFPLSMYELCARDMLRTFEQFWPEDVDIFIQLDCVTQEQHDAIQADLNLLFANSTREFYLANDWPQEQHDFYARNVDAPDTGYRFQVCKFSHKVFALLTAANHCYKSDHEMLIWLDADVLTHEPITHEVLEAELLPQGDQVSATLERKDAPHSECGFVAYALRKGGYQLIQEMADYYVTDKVLTLPGWTDCDVFDDAAKDYPRRNLSEGLAGWHVWPDSALGKYMEHRKGARKHNQGAKQPVKQPVKQASIPTAKSKAVDATNMQIKTRNCLPNERIQANVKENLGLIQHWVQYVKPHDEPIVIASAGPSLSYVDIKPWADAGVKIVTVKHAIDRLNEWGIKPWACVLLDPRPHVEGFVKKPDRDVIYFVASMVDPSVVRTLLDHGCHVVGYHAFVGAGESSLLQPGELMVSGGSATATRSIGMFHECLGFSEFHCYGYDLCHFVPPDPKALNEDGSPKYLEITLQAHTWGNKQDQRTFWTEGQLLAQAKELFDLYKMEQAFKIHLYGHGIAAWQQNNWRQFRAWQDLHNAKVETRKLNSLSLSEWQYGITGRGAGISGHSL